MKKLLTILASPIIALSMLGSVAHAAGTAAFTLSPASGSYTNGSSFTVQVHENGTSVNVVTAKLTYDSTKLACTATIGSAFTSVVSSCVAGAATFSGYPNFDASGNPTTVSGDQIVGTLNFTAINTGSAAVSFTSASEIASNGANLWNGVTTSGNYTITAASSQPSGGSTGSTGGNTGSTGGTGSTGNTGTKSGSGSKGSTGSTGSKTGSTGTGSTSTGKTGSTGSSSTGSKGGGKTTTGKSGSNSNSNSGKNSSSNKNGGKNDGKNIKTRHTGLVTSSLATVVIVLAGFYWLVIRKRPALATANAPYKLVKPTGKNSQAKSKDAAAHSKTIADKKSTGTKNTAKKA